MEKKCWKFPSLILMLTLIQKLSKILIISLYWFYIYIYSYICNVAYIYIYSVHVTDHVSPCSTSASFWLIILSKCRICSVMSNMLEFTGTMFA